MKHCMLRNIFRSLPGLNGRCVRSVKQLMIACSKIWGGLGQSTLGIMAKQVTIMSGPDLTERLGTQH